MIIGLADRLRETRTNCGLSQRTVAKRLGVSPSIISGYETGERTPSAEVLLALAYLYRCSTDYLLGKDTKKANRTLDVAKLTDQQIKILQDLVECMSV